jgi:hypothetical protein
MQVAYRLRVYDGLYSANSSTVLTPLAGSSHSDPFAISTISLSGYQPYMDMPRGKRGSFTPPTQKLEVGSYTVNILDKRTSTSNATRWVSAFIGGARGKLTLVGKKAFIEESNDGGSSWTPFFVGIITDINLENLNQVSITIKDNVEYLKDDIFQTVPRVNYAVYPTLWPRTITKSITNEENKVLIKRDLGIRVSFILKYTSTNGQSAAQLKFDGRHPGFTNSDSRNIWPEELGFGNASVVSAYNFNSDSGLRALVVYNGVEYVFGVESIATSNSTQSVNTPPSISTIRVYDLPTYDGGVGSVNSLPVSELGIPVPLSDVIQVYLFSINKDSTNKAGFYLIAPWKQVLLDLLDGKYYAPLVLSGSVVDVERKTSADTGSLDGILATRGIPRPAFYIDKESSGVEWLEKNLLAPYSVGYTMEPILSGSVPKSQARFFSTAVPKTIASVGTIAETDIIAATPTWEIAAPVSQVRGNIWNDYQKLPDDKLIVVGSNKNLDMARTQRNIVVVDDNEFAVDETQKVLTVELNGFRGFSTLLFGGLTYNSNDVSYQQGKAIEHLRYIFDRFKAGTPSVILKTIKSTNTNALQVGQFVNVSVSTLPNQALRQRGGTRLMQVVNKYSYGVGYEIELLDSGVNQSMASPSFSSLSNPIVGGAQFTVTTLENAIVHIQVAAVDAGGSVPSENSPAWVFAQRLKVNATSQMVYLDRLPEGRTIYIRGRCEALYDGDIKLPSAWVSVGNVTLSNIPTPSGVSVTDITTKEATVTWTNTSTTYAVEVFVASPAGSLTTRVLTLPAGSTRVTLTGLDQNTSTSHRVGIRYFDTLGGFGSFGTADFTASGTPPQLDAPAALLLYVTR